MQIIKSSFPIWVGFSILAIQSLGQSTLSPAVSGNQISQLAQITGRLRNTNPTIRSVSISSPLSSSSTVNQSTVAGAFNIRAPETIIPIDGQNIHFARKTFPEFASITAPTTVTTQFASTNHHGSQSTAAALTQIVVGPKGIWWDRDSPKNGPGITLPSLPGCPWPFCPPMSGKDKAPSLGIDPQMPKPPKPPGKAKPPSLGIHPHIPKLPKPPSLDPHLPKAPSYLSCLKYRTKDLLERKILRKGRKRTHKAKRT